MNKVLIILLSFVILSPPAQAEVDLKTLLQSYVQGDDGKKKDIEALVGSLGLGMSWTNQAIKGRKLYCQPNELALTDNQYMQMLMAAYLKVKTLHDAPFGLVLLRTLQSQFPCH